MSQSGYVIHTLQAAVAASLTQNYLDGILPIVQCGDDSDTTAAVAGAALGARGLLPPPHLIDGLCCNVRWPTWPAGITRGWPSLVACVPPSPGLGPTSPDTPDSEEDAAHRRLPTLPRFEFGEVSPGVAAGRAPLFRRNIWALRAAGVTHVLDLREEREWSGPGRSGPSALAEIGRLGQPRLHLPVEDMGIPVPSDFDRALAFIETVRHLGGTVYVHCRAGIERTAAILMAWCARQHACSDQEALAALRERRPALSPLPAQVNAVRAWLAASRE
ncbi:MAG: dual specificity protein phosphatase family protein [Chloroflexi bacterium]|nr:dual specificity protein phosphatase family protein [Chloroflexota bacterium]